MSGRKWASLFLVIAFVLGGAVLAWSPDGASSATQFNITLEYDESDDAVDPCDPDPPQAACGHTGDLGLILEAAAQHWESIFEDSHEVHMRYRWVDDADPSADVVETDASGRPTEVILRFPASFSYFYDPTPMTDEEFDMRPRLYRTVHPEEQAEAFQGEEPPEIFEASYNGLEQDGQASDLLSQALHEMGHALGLAPTILNARPVAECTGGDPWYDLDPALTGGADFELRAYNGSDCGHLDLGGITACKPPPGDQSTTSSEPSTIPGLTIGECTAHQALLWWAEYPNSRFRPGTADILAIALAAGWEEVNLPRKYTLGGTDGIWDEPQTWLGNRVPDVTNDVYIVNQAESVVINSYEEGGAARNLTITDGNILNVFFYDFLVEESISLQGEGTRLTADTSSHVDTFITTIGLGAMLDVPLNGFFDTFYLTSFGEIRGGGGIIDVVVLQNNGLIRGNGGLLRFTTSSSDIPFDIDGVGANAQIQALVGDISFEGEITDEVLANIEVGPGRYITFEDGWTQQASNNALHLLTLSGGDFEATINGPSTLNGLVVINQIARFTSDVEIGEFGRLAFSVGALDPGPGYDQLHIDGDATLDGQLIVGLEPGFDATPNDRYTLLTYGSHTGEFAVEDLPALDGGLTFLVDYGETEMDLVVGFAGADPDAPNCTGQAASTQAQEHGGMKNAAAFHGYPSVKAFQDAIAEFCGD